MSDPSEKKDLGNTDPSFGAPVTNTNSEPPAPVPLSDQVIEGSSVDQGVTSDPLFGATPPSNPEGEAGAKGRIEEGSRERVGALRRAREEVLGGQRYIPTQPYPPPPPITRLTRPPEITPTSRPSTLVPYIRKLGYILSLLLGAGATVSFIWSIFILPLLHSSFSARRALVDQQVDRVGDLVGRLRKIRGMGIHSGYISETSEGDRIKEGEVSGKKSIEISKSKREISSKLITNGKKEQEGIAMIRELTNSSNHSSSSSSSSSSTPESKLPQIPLIPELSPLLVSLKSLSSTRGNTSTTRTSLLSTIESYTSALHRQLWNPRPGAGLGGGWGTGYGLNTLDQSLRNESKGSGLGSTTSGNVYKDGWEGEGLGDRSEDWDNVRKEIRGIKGMLLGRRSLGV